MGVDVGTGSVRAALVTSNGKIKKMATCPLEVFNPAPNFYEQSSDNIWNAVCRVVQVGCLVKQLVRDRKILSLNFYSILTLSFAVSSC